MIVSKQMKELRSLDSRLRSLGQAKKPDLETHVMFAVVSGEIPKMKPVAKIAALARNKIVSERYSRNLAFSDVFASCNGYEGEMKVFNAYETKRNGCLSKYEKEARRIMLKAQGDNADAEAINEELHDAAERAGLNDLTPPKFGEPADTD